MKKYRVYYRDRDLNTSMVYIMADDRAEALGKVKDIPGYRKVIEIEEVKA